MKCAIYLFTEKDVTDLQQAVEEYNKYFSGNITITPEKSEKSEGFNVTIEYDAPEDLFYFGQVSERIRN